MSHNTKEQINNIRQKLADFVPVMDGLSRARNPFELRYFVIGKHDDRVQQYKQAVIEMEAKYKAIQEAVHQEKLKNIEKERLLLQMHVSPKDRLEELENEELQLKIDKIDYDDKHSKIAMTGAFKEVLDFITIIENEYSDLIDKTEEELLEDETEYWGKRFAKQVHVDMMAHGRISEGNMSALLMMPQEFQEKILKAAMIRTEQYKEFENRVANDTKILLAESYPHKTTFTASQDHTPLKLRKDAPDGYPEDCIVDIDRAEIMIATLLPPNDQKWLSQSFYIPTGKNNIKKWYICDNPAYIGEYRNKLVRDALSIGATHIFFVDNDLIVEEGALQKLYAHDLDVVGFKYVKKTPVPECASMITDGNGTFMPVPLDATGLMEINWALTAGGTLIKTDVFKKIPYPWYVTTSHGTEDTYFCARLREAGIKSYLDNDITAGHVDRESGLVYCCDGKIRTQEEYASLS